MNNLVLETLKNTSSSSSGDGAAAAGLIIVFIVLGLIFGIGGLAITIWGIVAAAKTEDTKINAGRLVLHLFLWGGWIAAIIYAVKASENNPTTYNIEVSKEEPAITKEVSLDEKIEKIDKLLEEDKITKAEHKELRDDILKKELED